VFNSGVLAAPSPTATFDYRMVPPELLARAEAMRTVCVEAGVSLPAAAVQFAMRHPAVHTVLVGARSPEEIVADVADATRPVPDSLWSALDAIAAA